jgi:primase-polymerase (primpol)-like protein
MRMWTYYPCTAQYVCIFELRRPYSPTVYDNVPNELKNLRQWVCYKLESRKNAAGELIATKVPYQLNGNLAKTTDPSTWNTLAACAGAVGRPGFAGVGFVFTKSARYAGIDLDKCRDIESGVTETWASDIINELNSYTELSQSGRGWHIIVRGLLAPGRNRAGRVELYDHARYFVMSGNRLQGYDHIEPRDLTDLQTRLPLLDPTYQPTSARGKRSLTKARRALTSQSERDYADIALMALITASNNPDRVEREYMRRFPDRYEERNRVKGARGDKSYIRYSIEHFLERKYATVT